MARHQPKLVKAEPATIMSRIANFETLTNDELIEAICADDDLWFVKFIDHNPRGHYVDPDFEDN